MSHSHLLQTALQQQQCLQGLTLPAVLHRMSPHTMSAHMTLAVRLVVAGPVLVRRTVRILLLGRRMPVVQTCKRR